MGFFTDTSVCIGCKACEVACKEWNQIPDDGFLLTGMSYDNTAALGASTWRHVAFVEKPFETVAERPPQGPPVTTETVDLGMPDIGPPAPSEDGVRWLMSSDVCKHCTHAGCLDVCPTGALFRTEFGTVVVQPDVCNGCGYCVSACPYGVIDIRQGDGRAFKCTLCYDRLKEGQTPACAQACPTESIQFGGRGRRVLPAARRAGGLRPAARPGRPDPVAGLDLEARRVRRRHGGRPRRRVVPGEEAVNSGAVLLGRPHEMCDCRTNAEAGTGIQGWRSLTRRLCSNVRTRCRICCTVPARARPASRRVRQCNIS
jgi:Fe-S-cluster-containing dehydrogenase component